MQNGYTKETKMNATYTTRNPGYAATVAAPALPNAVKTGLMLLAAPIIGLVFVLLAPGAALALAAWMTLKATPVIKRVALFLAAPFVGLAYLLAMPFVGLGAIVYYALRAARN